MVNHYLATHEYLLKIGNLPKIESDPFTALRTSATNYFNFIHALICCGNYPSLGAFTSLRDYAEKYKQAVIISPKEKRDTEVLRLKITIEIIGLDGKMDIFPRLLANLTQNLLFVEQQIKKAQ